MRMRPWGASAALCMCLSIVISFFLVIPSPLFAQLGLLDVDSGDAPVVASTAETDDDVWLDELSTDSATNRLFSMTFDERISRIKELAFQWRVDADEEEEILTLIETMPENEAGRFLSALRADGAKLLRELETSIDGDRYQKLHALILQKTFESMTPEEALAKLESAKVFPWSDPGLLASATFAPRFYFETVELKDDGSMFVEFWANRGFLGMKAEPQTLDPLEIIGIFFLRDEQTFNMKKGEYFFGPAFALRALKRKQNMTELRAVVDVACIFAGGMGLVTATTRLARVVAVMEVAFSAADMVINEARMNLAESESGKEFLRYWDISRTLVAVYGVGRLVVGASVGVFKTVSTRYRAAREILKDKLPADQLRKLDDEIESLARNADEAPRTGTAANTTANRAAHSAKLFAKLKSQYRAEEVLIKRLSRVSKNQLRKRPVAVAVTHPDVPDVAVALAGKAPTAEAINPGLLERLRRLGQLGQKTACGNTLGCCAEFRAANRLLNKYPNLKIEDLVFTRAVRPVRPEVTVPYCDNCVAIFGL